MNFKRFIIICYDVLTIPVAWFGAYWIRANFTELPHQLMREALILLPIVLIVQVVAFWFYDLYRGQWRFASIHDLVRICKAVVLASVGILVIVYFTTVYFRDYASMPPRSIIPLYFMLLIGLLGGARLSFRWLKETRNPDVYQERVLVVGAGYAGEALVRELFRDHAKRYFPVGFVDDSKRKQGVEILGVRVLGAVSEIPNLVVKYNLQQVVIAIPSATAKTMRRIVDFCNKAGVSYRTLPGISDVIAGNVTISDLRAVSLEDLLGREPINLHDPVLYQAFTGQKIVVTGGGGSIGSELCRQLAKFQPKQLIILEHSEFNLYEIERYLRAEYLELSLICCLVDITEATEVNNIIGEYKPNIIFHAAAYKHVPMLESQVTVAIKNNVLGTKVMAEAADANNVDKFVLISTDKAVNPTNVMGASKRMAEIFCQNFNSFSKTRFITVRFGNVLGSAGSVIPLFQKQLEAGGPITVTHPDITRYFMTISETSQLILQASLFGNGGEIYVLDMGEPIKIAYLAEQMIKLSGKTVGNDIAIKYTGLRPGEKLYEELFYHGEKLQNPQHEKIFEARYREIDWQLLNQVLSQLQEGYSNNDPLLAIKALLTLIPEAQLPVNISQPES